MQAVDDRALESLTTFDADTVDLKDGVVRRAAPMMKRMIPGPGSGVARR
jgi:hypothetical protein